MRRRHREPECPHRQSQLSDNAAIDHGGGPLSCVIDGNPLATIAAKAAALDTDR